MAKGDRKCCVGPWKGSYFERVLDERESGPTKIVGRIRDSHQGILESRMLGNLARPVWGWGPGEIPGPTPLFCGSVAGGERNAGFMSLVSSAHRNDLEVWAYVSDVLRQLLAGETDYEPLLPWNWAATHPESVREFRKEERRARQETKQTARAKRRAKLKRRKQLAKR